MPHSRSRVVLAEKKMNKLLTTITVLTLFFSATIYSQTKFLYPHGWRLAEKSDYSAENLSFLNNSVPNHVEADFNGDGIRKASLPLKGENMKGGLFKLSGVMPDL